jgi:hypothetical protein
MIPLEPTSKRSLDNAGRAEHVVVLSFNVRIRVRGNACSSLQELYTFWLYSPGVESSAKGLAKLQVFASHPQRLRIRSGAPPSPSFLTNHSFFFGGEIFRYGMGGRCSGSFHLIVEVGGIRPNSVPRSISYSSALVQS